MVSCAHKLSYEDIEVGREQTNKRKRSTGNFVVRNDLASGEATDELVESLLSRSGHEVGRICLGKLFEFSNDFLRARTSGEECWLRTLNLKSRKRQRGVT